jgi:phosphopantothenoylcysteine decarboxylase/phosphopantothenate--cysteine ligase
MLEASLEAGKDADIIIGAAAVADYRVANPVSGKMRRSEELISLQLVPNPDVIASLAKAFPQATVVGFAAEPSSDLSIAREKLIRKGIHAIAVNDVSQPGIGFDSDNNEITLITQDWQTVSSGRQSKLACALWLLERVAQVRR